ncbi:Ligand-gated ion channel 4 [Hypsibius exemplaris]|uniref:Ligand-gated ion channel 4 n=1 Tax=Hypsibius exemplaris TaxID=2072580 RepID=A0A1W0WYG2_HYPEX|nr:Ligand-gated ion channel 4 [Hypsibius exemplaris]
MDLQRVVTLLGAILLVKVPRSGADEHEYRLMSYLLDNYNKAVRPAKNHTEPLTVTFGVALTQLIDVDEKNQIMTTNCWLNQVWMDHNLKWNPAHFGNITTIRVPANKIWKPDLLLYNNADSDYYHKIISTNAILQFDGNVTWLATTIFRSSCEINVRFFPFDQQNCTLKFASWTYDGYKVDLIIPTGEGDTSNYVQSCEWDLINMTAKRNVVFYSCCAEPYPDITINLVIRRRPLFYVFNYLMPCSLITVLAFLGFYTPSESGEKVTLGITTLLSMTVFLMMVSESMPPTSESLPLIAMYYGITIFLVALATAVQVLTLNMHHRGTRGQKVPGFLKTFVLGYMAPCLCIHIAGTSKQYRHHTVTTPNDDDYIRPATRISIENTHHTNRGLQPNGLRSVGVGPGARLAKENEAAHEAISQGQDNFNHPFLDTFERQFLRVLNKVYQTIERNEVRLQEQDFKDSLCLEWQEILFGIIKDNHEMDFTFKWLSVLSVLVIFTWSFEHTCGHPLNESWPHHERDLANYLLQGYNKDVRPVKHQVEVVTVTLGVALTQLISVDEKRMILTTNCWLNQMWLDPKLAWKPERFDNLTSILLPVSKIWKPDILLYNTADAAYYHKIISTNVIIHHTGNVTWLVSSIFRSSCDLNMRDFPFDHQICPLKFASWTYDGLKVDLTITTPQADLSSYVPSGEWDLLNFTAHRDLVEYYCCSAPYPEITVNLIMRRRPLYYVFTYMMPCIGCTGFVFLGFILPGECGEKVFLDIKVLLSLILFFFTVGEVMPPTATTVPLIALYYVTSMLFVSLATAFQVWTLNLHYRGSRGQQIPLVFKTGFLKRIISLIHQAKTSRIELNRQTSLNKEPKLAAAIGNRSPTRHSDLVRGDIDKDNFNRYFREQADQPVVHLPLSPGHAKAGKNGYKRQQALQAAGHFPPVSMPQYSLELDLFERRLSTILNAICDMIEKSEKRLMGDEEMDQLTREWQSVAVSMDRLLLTVFLIVVSTVFLLLFISVSSTYEMPA